MTPLRSLLLPALASLAGIVALTGLGLWQVERLAWKEAILARIEARVGTPPSALPPEGAWTGLAPDDYDYRHVTATGRFEHDKEALVFRTLEAGKASEGGAGWLVLTPLRLPDGSAVIVNRGFVPEAMREAATRPKGQVQGEVTLTGLMRPPEARNAFTPANNPPKNQWFTRDPAAIAAALGVTRAAPFTIDADAGPRAILPRGGMTVTRPPNSHLSYALTWFALALTLAGVFAAFAWRRLRA